MSVQQLQSKESEALLSTSEEVQRPFRRHGYTLVDDIVPVWEEDCTFSPAAAAVGRRRAVSSPVKPAAVASSGGRKRGLSLLRETPLKWGSLSLRSTDWQSDDRFETWEARLQNMPSGCDLAETVLHCSPSIVVCGSSYSPEAFVKRLFGVFGLFRINSPEYQRELDKKEQGESVGSGKTPSTPPSPKAATLQKNLVALMQASERGDLLTVRQLLHAGVPMRIQGRNGNTPLILCAKKGNVMCMRSLICMGKAAADDVNVQENNGWTALMHATMLNHTDCIDALLAIPGIDIDIQSAKFLVRQMPQVDFRHLGRVMKSVCTLMPARARGDSYTQSKSLDWFPIGTTALMIAVKMRRADLVVKLLTAPMISDIGLKDAEGRTALDFANDDVLKILREYAREQSEC